MKPSVAWSEFALSRNFGRGQVERRFTGSADALLNLVRRNWKHRYPGTGRSDLRQVVIVPIRGKKPLTLFRNNWTTLKEATHIRGKIVRRQPEEDPFVRIVANGRPLPTRSARVVLYSAETLLENKGTRSSSASWEIVALLTGPWENEPMDPLTMARNYLQKPGGTYAKYTADQFAESVYFWSQYVERRTTKK